MGFIAITTFFCICLSSALATYGPEYKNGNGFKPILHHHHDAPKGGYHQESKIHLDSPKIILNRPSISVHGPTHSHDSLHHGSVLHEDEPIILENEKPLLIRKTLHGIHSGHSVPATPVLLDSGYSHGKVLDIAAPVQVINHAPIVQERPILIRRPVVVSKGLTSTQDHLENLHYAHSGIAHGGLYSHGGHYSVPVSQGLHERTLVYSSGALGHGSGHGLGYLSGHSLGYGLGHSLGHVVPATYSAPLILQQPRAYLAHADIGHGSVLHGHGAVLHGAPLHAPVLHSHAPVHHSHSAPLKKY